MKLLAKIGISGKLKLTVSDATTGKILQVEEGDNLVLNTGLTSLCNLLSGNITVPSDITPGMILNETNYALPDVPLYGQFGMNTPAINRGTTPGPDDKSDFTNGTLDSSATSPSAASDIVKATSYSSSKYGISFQFTLAPNQGNGLAGAGMTYKEAVLMSKISDDPLTYNWFARKTFSSITKNTTTIISGEWTFAFINNLT